MDNNTAPNNGITYPDLAGSPPTSPVASTPVVAPTNDDQILSDLANQLKQIQQTDTPVVSTAPTQVTPPPVVQPVLPQQPVVQPTPQVQPTPVVVPVPEVSPVVEPPKYDLPTEPVPAPTALMTENTIGVVRASLEDIIPGTKVPKALQRDPKENNLAKPIKPEEVIPTIRKDQAASTPVQILDETPRQNNIDEYLRIAVERGASDLHLSVGYPPMLRIDGVLKNINENIITPQDAQDLILSILSDEKKELLEVNREIDFAYFYQGEQSARFRVNAYFTMKNLAAAFRLIPSRVKTLEELLLPQIYNRFAQLKQGLILVTGPTGHGKSTTLAAIIEEVNRTRFSHVVTIEDPIEYVFEGKRALIDQREMNDDTHSWNIALRSALRQDPDVILVGEMRDYETIAAAITLAETGHLVFATLHTNNTAQTIDRIIDVFPENQQPQIRSQLSNILEAVVAQRLVPLDKGGRRAVSEILIANPAVRNLIREGKTHQIDNVIRTSSDIGMVSLERSLVNLVREGVISVQKAQEYSIYPEEVLRLLKS